MKFYHEKNNCHLCEKKFCCIKCRQNHERTKHGIYPDCEICLYGKTVFNNPSENLISHIQENHWPLHCVLCKHTFESVRELFEHPKCCIKPRESSTDLAVHPKICINNQKLDKIKNMENESKCLDSPQIGNLISKQEGPTSSSTPMALQTKNLWSPNIISVTPVDPIENKESKNLKNSQNNSVRFKRSVTFSDTPSEFSRQKRCKILENSRNKTEVSHLKFLDLEEKPNIRAKRILVNNDFQDKEKKINSVISSKRYNMQSEPTLWQSAINQSSKFVEETEEKNEENGNVEENINKVEKTTIYNFHQHNILNTINIHINSESPKNQVGKIDGTNKSNDHKTFLSSITCMVKSAMNIFSGKRLKFSHDENMLVCNKRNFSELENSQASDNAMHKLKKIKLGRIQCRPTIRILSPTLYRLTNRQINLVDKATQTDF